MMGFLQLLLLGVSHHSLLVDGESVRTGLEAAEGFFIFETLGKLAMEDNIKGVCSVAWACGGLLLPRFVSAHSDVCTIAKPFDAFSLTYPCH